MTSRGGRSHVNRRDEWRLAARSAMNNGRRRHADGETQTDGHPWSVDEWRARARHVSLSRLPGCTTTSAFTSATQTCLFYLSVHSYSIVTHAQKKKKKNLSACMHLPGILDTTYHRIEAMSHTHAYAYIVARIGLHSFSCLSLCRFLSPVLILAVARG